MAYYKVVLGNKKDDSSKGEIHVKFSIAPGDIPFGVRFKQSEKNSGACILDFDYSNDQEKVKEIDRKITDIGEVSVVYGVNSGRIYSVHFPKEVTTKELLTKLNVVKKEYIQDLRQHLGKRKELKPRIERNINFGQKIVRQSLELHDCLCF